MPTRVELAGFRGKLEEISLPSLLCILETERRTGVLVLNLGMGRGKARLHLRKGRVRGARMTRGKGPLNADLVYKLIGASRGTFDFRPSSVPLGDEIRSSTAQLILGGIRSMNQARNSARSESVMSGGEGPRRAAHTALVPGSPVDAVHRWISPKVAASVFVMAVFVMVVIMAGVYSGQDATGSRYRSAAVAPNASAPGSASH